MSSFQGILALATFGNRSSKAIESDPTSTLELRKPCHAIYHPENTR
jgi:hypothetical protein